MKIDAVMPQGNEDGLIQKAIGLGFDEIILLSDDINYRCASSNDKIKVKKGFLLKDPNMINKARKNFDYMFAPAERKFFEHDIDYVLGAELSDRKDSFHYRNTSLNQVHAKLAKEHDIMIVFDLGLLLNSNLKNRQIYLGRMLQNAQLVRKYKLKSAIFTLTKDPSAMRSYAVISSMKNVLKL